MDMHKFFFEHDAYISLFGGVGVVDEALRILNEALLGNRVKEFVRAPLAVEETLETGSVLIGVSVDGASSKSNLDKGPAADQPEAAKFQKLWGEKAELRYVADGTGVFEAVVWPTKSQSACRNIVRDSITHILKRHLDIPSAHIQVFLSQFDPILSCDPSGHSVVKVTSKSGSSAGAAGVSDGGKPYGTGEEAGEAIRKVYSSLSTQLRGLTLPLNIVSVQGACPALRHTEVYPPLPVSTKSAWNMVPLQVLVTLEDSFKWGTDQGAVEALMTLFIIKVSEELVSTCDLQTKVTPPSVLVVKDGYLFEIMLHRSQDSRKSLSSSGDLDDQRLLQQLSSNVTSSCHNLQSICPSFSATARVAKRWLSSKMASPALGRDPDLVIDLLVSSVFLSPAPFKQPPETPAAGFLRFLYLLANHDWKGTPIVVNFGSQLTDQELKMALRMFRLKRPSYPALTLIAPFEGCVQLTKHTPSPPVLKRLQQEAVKSLTTALQAFSEHTLNDKIKEMFCRPKMKFDAVLRLKSNINGPYVQEYLDDLQFHYGTYCLFLYDKYRMDNVGMIWMPDAEKSWGLSEEWEHENLSIVSPLTLDSTDTERDVLIGRRKSAILDHIRVLGRDLVDSLKIKAKK